MMAPTHHASMRHVGPVRVELGTRTIFNLLGPLSNPASVKRQVVGVFSPGWLEPIAENAARARFRARLGRARLGRLDEMTTTGPTHVVELKDGRISRFDVTPADAGLKTSTLDDLKGGDPAVNAVALKGVLQGARNAYRDIAVLNAAAGLVVAERAATLSDAAPHGRVGHPSIRGAALQTLDRLSALSNA